MLSICNSFHGNKTKDMNKEQKQEVIEALKDKFTQYSNFYITNTESLSVAQITNLRRHCFNKQVEMKVAKNTLIKKALESLDNEKYSGVYDSLHQVTALMFSESPKEPALIISSFRKEWNQANYLSCFYDLSREILRRLLSKAVFLQEPTYLYQYRHCLQTMLSGFRWC